MWAVNIWIVKPRCKYNCLFTRTRNSSCLFVSILCPVLFFPISVTQQLHSYLIVSLPSLSTRNRQETQYLWLASICKMFIKSKGGMNGESSPKLKNLATLELPTHWNHIGIPFAVLLLLLFWKLLMQLITIGRKYKKGKSNSYIESIVSQ